MKNRFKILYVFLGVALLFTACTPTDYELGAPLDKSALKFSITPDSKEPNMIILKSLTPGVTPQWITPLGRSTRVQDTVKIAFAGTYKFVYGVESAGGLVQADTVTLNITKSNFAYVNDPLWTNLTGGVGNQKTWRLDYGSYGLASGPLTYCEPQTTWTEWQAGTAKIGWAPSWKDNTWIISADDQASRMTFSLKGGAFMTTHKVVEGVDESGTFMLNTSNHTLTTTNATILRSSGFIAKATNWNNNLVILSLTANQLMVGVRRVTADESDYLYVWNFVSDDYANSYVAPKVSYSEPIKDTFTKKDLVGTWRYSLVAQNWISWEVSGSGTGGSQENNWFTRNDMITSWLGNASTFTNADANTYVFNADGTCNLNGTANTYTVTNGTITFGTPLTGKEWSLVYISLTGNSVNVLNVTSIGTTPYTSNGIWIGQRNAPKNEDMAVQLVKQ
jgi:hypothetical protein